MNDERSTGSEAQRMRRHYLPFNEVEPGMQLGEAIALTDRSKIIRFSLPVGHALTEDNLRQLAAHRAEFVCIARPDSRSDEEVAADNAAAAARVVHIFEGADLAQPVVAALFDRVLAYRSK